MYQNIPASIQLDIYYNILFEGRGWVGGGGRM